MSEDEEEWPKYSEAIHAKVIGACGVVLKGTGPSHHFSWGKVKKQMMFTPLFLSVQPHKLYLPAKIIMQEINTSMAHYPGNHGEKRNLHFL